LLCASVAVGEFVTPWLVLMTAQAANIDTNRHVTAIKPA
jgi:hypothetical protein